jgi:hypothetical protein
MIHRLLHAQRIAQRRSDRRGAVDRGTEAGDGGGCGGVVRRVGNGGGEDGGEESALILGGGGTSSCEYATVKVKVAVNA